MNRPAFVAAAAGTESVLLGGCSGGSGGDGDGSDGATTIKGGGGEDDGQTNGIAARPASGRPVSWERKTRF